MITRRTGMMARMFASVMLATFVLYAVLFGVVSRVRAVAPANIVNYQGRLLNTNGVPVADTSASIAFEFYTASSGGSCVWSNSSSTCASATARTVTLTDGLFTENLGDTAHATPYAAINDATFSDNAAIYLQVTVNTEPLTPRKRIVAAPYALNASTIDGFNSTQVGGTSALALVLDTNGNLQLTGNPQGTGVAQGSLYINPTTANISANEMLFGVAVDGTSRFTIDEGGDTTITGTLAVNGGGISSTLPLVISSSGGNINVDPNGSGLFFVNVGDDFAVGASALVAPFSVDESSDIVRIGDGVADADIPSLVMYASDATNFGSLSFTDADAFAFTDANVTMSGTLVVTGNVDANAGLDVAGASLTVGGGNFSVSTAGLLSTVSNAAINGGGISSTAALTISSSGGNVNIDPNGSGLFFVNASDDFAVGSSSLTAPFSFDESANEVRIGDGVNDTNDPKVTFYASDATNSGTLSFTDGDTFTFANGKLSEAYSFDQSTLATGGHNATTSAGTVTGTSAAGRNLTIIGIEGTSTYSGALGAGSSHTIIGTSGSVDLGNASAVLTEGIGIYGSVYNQSTNAAAVSGVGYLAGGSFVTQHDAAQTISLGYGAYAKILASQGTITTGAAVVGEVASGGGSFTTGYGGKFSNMNEGATRYGVFAEASGGATANYAGYFAAARVQIDTDIVADAMTIANAAGDLGISNDLESHGSGRFGDTTGVDDFIFSSAATTAPIMQVIGNSLTSGLALGVSRADDASGTAYNGKLVTIEQMDVTSSGSIALNVQQAAAGNSAGLFVTQTNVADQTNGAGGTTVGGQALILETPEVASNDDIMLIRSNGQLVLAIETDGSVLSDNGYSAAGADYAEYFPTNDPTLGYYEMTCIDGTQPLSVKRCEAGNQQHVGIISSNPGFIGNLPRNGETGNALVGMVGQIETYVNAGEGAIAIGDPITTSATTAGYGAKSHGPARIVGFALEPLASGTGTIRVLVQPQWYGGDVLASDGSAIVASANIVMAPMRTATAASSGDSRDLVLRGSGWDGAAAVAKSMTLRNDVTNGSDSYQLSVVNDAGSQVAYIGSTGDLAIAGKLYPSDRGTLQTSKYIYYDGSSGAGGDFMRTNASGWGSGSYDFAEMFPSQDLLAAGEVVVFADTNESIRRSTGATYDDRIAGVVSTRPGFLAGDNKAGDVPVALAGRVPTYVSGENGAIAIGDPLTTSSKAGYAMKATEPGPIVGYAMEAFSGTTGAIITFIRPSYFDGNTVDAPVAENVVSAVSSVATLDVSGSMNMNGGSILSIASLTGIGGNWRMMENGDFVTRGSIVALIRSFNGEEVETYAALGREHTVQLSGTAILRNGMVKVEFEMIDPTFNDVIANEVPYRVFVTPAGMAGTVYVSERSNEGFTVRDSANTNGVAVDWLVVAYHKDFAPATVIPDALAPEASEDVLEAPVVGEDETDAADDVVEEVPVIEDEVPAVEEETPMTEPAETPAVVVVPAEDDTQSDEQVDTTPAVTEEEVDAPIADTTPVTREDTAVSTETTEDTTPTSTETP